MVEVGQKPETARTATAGGSVLLSREAFLALRDGTSKKGDVLAVARVAGIQAAKRTSEWIPLCHPVPLTSVDVEFSLDEEGFGGPEAPEKGARSEPEGQASAERRHRVDLAATARCVGRTGVEMEALTAVTAAALTIYDMLKAVDRGMRIENIRLLHKAGGKSGEWRAA